MIVPVTKANELDWAQMCLKLWPDHTLDEFITERANNQMPYEFLYYQNNQSIAFISLSLRHDYIEGVESIPAAYLEGIYVEPEYRGQQIGKQLVEFAKAWGKTMGCKELASDCELDNTSSERFHKAIGFKEVNRIICFVMNIDE